MMERIVLLTGPTEAPYLGEILRRRNPGIVVDHAADTATLRACISSPAPTTRLIAFSTDVIVPADCLDAAMSPAYNFHAGPPSYPGASPAAFAVYEGATMFGVTVHEMATRVDSGAIVAAPGFAVDPATTRADLEGRAYTLLIETFATLAEFLATDPGPLPRLDVSWQGPLRTRAEADRLRDDVNALDPDERARRRRAFGPPRSDG